MSGPRTRFSVAKTAAMIEALLLALSVVPLVPPRLLHRSIGAMQAKRFVDWSFGHYLDIAPPSFAEEAPPPRAARRAPARIAA